ncbi:MAG: TetR/AcrR family transcriptional regulator [Bacteroidales bacterium]
MDASSDPEKNHPKREKNHPKQEQNHPKREQNHPKREQILQTGKVLFWKFGFRRVTIEELCKEAGVSKMTFYKYFSNKMDLVKTIMRDFGTASLEKYRAIIDSDLPYPEKVLGMIRLKRDQTEAMSNEFFRDYTDLNDPEMVRLLEEMSAGTFEMFVKDLSDAQKAGDIRKDVKVEFILYFLNHMMEMIHDERLIAMYDNPQDLAMEIINFFFYGLLNRDKK